MFERDATDKKAGGLLSISPWSALRVALPRDGSWLNVWEVLGRTWAGFQARGDFTDGQLSIITVTCPRGAVVRRVMRGQFAGVSYSALPVLWAQNEAQVEPTAEDDEEKPGFVLRKDAVLAEAERAAQLLRDELKARGRPRGSRDTARRRLRRRD